MDSGEGSFKKHECHKIVVILHRTCKSHFLMVLWVSQSQFFLRAVFKSSFGCKAKKVLKSDFFILMPSDRLKNVKGLRSHLQHCEVSGLGLQRETQVLPSLKVSHLPFTTPTVY